MIDKEGIISLKFCCKKIIIKRYELVSQVKFIKMWFKDKKFIGFINDCS